MKRLLGLTICFLLFSGFTVHWDAVNTYTDGSSIEASKTVTYTIRKDNVVIGSGITGTSLVFTDNGHGLTRQFTAQTVLSTGEVSAESPPYSWTVPLGVPANPANLRVAP